MSCNVFAAPNNLENGCIVATDPCVFVPRLWACVALVMTGLGFKIQPEKKVSIISVQGFE
jgi:hypothetical protein